MVGNGSARMQSARTGRAFWRIVAGGLTALMLFALGAASASATPELKDFSGGAFQILAPGAEGGYTPGPQSTDQGELYDALTSVKKVTQKYLEKDYLSEKFGVQGPILRTETT